MKNFTKTLAWTRFLHCGKLYKTVLLFTSIFIFTMGYSQNYCAAYNNINTAFYISNVTTAGAQQNIDQDRSNINFNNGYKDFTSDIIQVNPDSYFTLNVTFTVDNDPKAEYNVSVWADIDHNNSFWNTGEKIMSTNHNPIPGGDTYSNTFHVPAWFPNGTYIIRIRASAYNGTTLKPCMGNKYSDTQDFTVEVVRPCLTPTGLSATNLTTNTADIDWTQGASEVNWDVAWGEAGTFTDADSAPNSIEVNGSASTSLSELTANTGYTVYVRSACSSTNKSDWSAPIDFTTPCTPTSIPFTQNFNGASIPNLPNCSSTQAVTGDGYWETAYAVLDFTGKMLRFHYNSSFVQNDNWYFTRGIQLYAGVPYQISYKYGTASHFLVEKLKVAYGASPNESAMTSVLADHPNIDDSDLHGDTLDFTPSSSGIYYFGFDAYSNGEQYFLFVDDISIIIVPPARPTSPDPVTNITQVQGFTDFTYYPNPVDGLLNIKAANAMENIKVYTMLGQMVINSTPKTAQAHLDTSGLQPGVYLMRVTMKKGQTKTFRIVKK